MLKFNEEHQNFNGSISKQKGRRVKSLIASGILLTSACLFSGCDKDSRCDVEELHAHKFVSETGIHIYDVREYDSSHAIYIDHNTYTHFPLCKTDEYINISEDEYEYYKFLKFNNLVNIDDNIDSISKIFSEHSPYEYILFEYVSVTRVRVAGGGIATSTRRYWTNNPNTLNLTGNIKLCREVYYGYNVCKNEKGKYELIKSSPFYTLEDLVNSEYKFTSYNFFQQKEYSDVYNPEYVEHYFTHSDEQNIIQNDNEHKMQKGRSR